LIEYSEMNSKCELCKDLLDELKYDSSSGERLEHHKKWFFQHQIERHNEDVLF